MNQRSESLAAITGIKRQAPALVTLNFAYMGDYIGRQAWARCKARKATPCVMTGKCVEVGDEVYRPVSNARNRMYRISADVIDGQV